MKWNIQYKSEGPNLKSETPDDIVKILLENRGLTSKQDIKNFLSPKNPVDLTLEEVEIDPKQISKAIKRIKDAIKKKEQIVVYGDYDADGICSAAIIWECLRDLEANALPFIPLREKEGYGLSKDGIDSILLDEKTKNTSLIISVDSGIVAHDAVDYATLKNVDVIILDHHEKEKSLPKAFAIIHTQRLCAAGISYIFSNNLLFTAHKQSRSSIELAAIATVTDLMPLLGPNRSIVKYGLDALNKTTRVGLRALFSVAGIEKVGTYEVGFMIGPRLNASGRIESALLALRMLCTSDYSKALEYARQLNDTNKQRQDMMGQMTLHAISKYDGRQINGEKLEKIIVIEHESYHQGIIGLIAGKLVEKYYLPSIVIAKGEEVSKASARSISGFNIIEAIRHTSEILLGAGGHPMAAGFSIETSRIEEFRLAISKIATEKITDDLLNRVLAVDTRIDFDLISVELYQQLIQFEPFGMGNREPTFISEVVVRDFRTVGQDSKHLKLTLSSIKVGNSRTLDAIAFNKGELSSKIKLGNKINVAYNIDFNTFNGRSNLQLKIKDIVLE